MSSSAFPFTGELMVCVLCHAEHKSEPHVQSQWTAIEIQGARAYACPKCIPGADPLDPKNENKIMDNYERFLQAGLRQLGAVR